MNAPLRPSSSELYAALVPKGAARVAGDRTNGQVRLFTIGFTEKPAERFFELLRAAQVRRIVDVRLSNDSQLAGFSKRRDLEYFLREILDVGYVHLPELAPTRAMLDDLKKRGGAWAEYEGRFLALMQERRIEDTVDPAVLDEGCLLCSEHDSRQCHRRLVAEYLSSKWGDVVTTHLK